MVIRKIHSKQSKFQAALALLKADQTVSELTQHYGVHATVLHRWKRELLEKGPEIFGSGTPLPDKQGEIDNLQRKIGQLTMEVDFLKRALHRSGLN